MYNKIERSFVKFDAHDTRVYYSALEQDQTKMCTMFDRIKLAVRDKLIHEHGVDIPRDMCVYDFMVENGGVLEICLPYISESEIREMPEDEVDTNTVNPDTYVTTYILQPVQTVSGLSMVWYRTYPVWEPHHFLCPNGILHNEQSNCRNNITTLSDYEVLLDVLMGGAITHAYALGHVG